MSKVRCAVIGAGWWATTAHLPVLKSHPDVQLVAVQSLDKSKIQQIARDFGASKSLTRWEDLLAIEGLDAVVIASTPNMHFMQAKAALSRGLHVMLEKPMTFTAREAAELVKLAESKKLHFVASFPWHFTRHAIEAKRLIESGEVGQVKMISIMMIDECLGLYQGLPWKEIFGDGRNPECQPEPYVEPGRRSYADPSISGGGQIYAQVCHVAAYLTYLTGKEATEVFARFDNGPVNIDVYNVVNVKLDGGILAGITSTGATGRTKRACPVTVFGSKGVIHLDLFDGTMSFQTMDGNRREFSPLTEAENYPMGDPVRNLLDLITKQTTVNRSPGALGAAAMRIVEGSCRSVQQHTNVSVPWW
jgi:predicted dehydrogenase